MNIKMEIKINDEWHEVRNLTYAFKNTWCGCYNKEMVAEIQDIKLNGKQLFGNSEQVIVQEQSWYKLTRYLLTLDGASVQLETYPIPQGQFNVKAYIYALWVDADKRRQGKATKLMDMAERIAKQHGYEEVFLDWSVKEAAQSTLAWYGRRGYKSVAFNDEKTLLKKEL
jgi:ribosomal protein S18 acetylase RimI-like enzyme